MVQFKIQPLQIHQKILQPQGGPLAQGGGLSGLEMGIGQSGGVPVPGGEIRQGIDGRQKQAANLQQAFPHLNHVGVIAHIAGSRAQVDNGHGQGAKIPEGVQVSHYVVTKVFLVFGHSFIINVVDMGAHLVDLRLGDVQPQLLLAFGQGDPQPAPGGEFEIRGEDMLHLFGCVAGTQGTFIGRLHGHIISFHAVTMVHYNGKLYIYKDGWIKRWSI